jgi:hypothetical protein
MGKGSDSESDLALQPEDAENVVGGVRKKQVKAKLSGAGYVTDANIPSTSVAGGTPSPLGPQPDESYMDPSV